MRHKQIRQCAVCGDKNKTSIDVTMSNCTKVLSPGEFIAGSTSPRKTCSDRCVTAYRDSRYVRSLL